MGTHQPGTHGSAANDESSAMDGLQNMQEHRESKKSKNPGTYGKAAPRQGSPPAKQARYGKVLLLFSGPHQRKDRLAAFLSEEGIVATEVDVINTHLKGQNVLDDAAWAD